LFVDHVQLSFLIVINTLFCWQQQHVLFCPSLYPPYFLSPIFPEVGSAYPPSVSLSPLYRLSLPKPRYTSDCGTLQYPQVGRLFSIPVSLPPPLSCDETGMVNRCYMPTALALSTHFKGSVW